MSKPIETIPFNSGQKETEHVKSGDTREGTGPTRLSDCVECAKTLVKLSENGCGEDIVSLRAETLLKLLRNHFAPGE